MVRRVSNLWLAGLLVLLAALVSSCRADLNVDVDVEPDGSGLVEAEVFLDQEAADRLLDVGRDSAGVPLSDLAQAGWEIDPPAEGENGEVTITASKAFGTPRQFSDVMAELGGETGLFQDFTLAREQSFGRLDYKVDGILDTTDGFGEFSDPELNSTLDRSLQDIAEYYGANENDISVRLSVTIPGEIQEDDSNAAFVQEDTSVTSQWSAAVGRREAVEVTMASTRRSITAQVLRGVAVVAAVLAGLLLFARLLRLVSARRRAPARKQGPVDAQGRPTKPQPSRGGPSVAARPSGSTDPGSAKTPGGAAGVDGENGAGTRQFRVVALDGMGVLYREGDDIEKLLIPFARKRGSTVAAADIAARARQVSLGRMTSASFWPAIGVEGDVNELDAAYLATHQLMPGVIKYLRRLRSHGIRAACITNDGAEWAMKLRSTHSLEGLVDPWVVSGSVGVRKPDKPIFEVLRRVTGEPSETILVVDDNLETLDAARSYGFGTAWFTVDGEREDARGHEILRNFNLAEDDGFSAELAASVTGEIASGG